MTPPCARCRRPQSLLHRLIVNYDDAMHEREPLRRNLCARCTSALEAWLTGAPALSKFRSAVDGPPFLAVMLDEESMRALAGGAVNSRTEVAAAAVIAAFDAATVKKATA